MIDRTIGDVVERIVDFIFAPIMAVLSPVAFSVPGFSAHGPAIFVAAVIVLLLAPAAWVYLDARNRNKSGIIAILFIFLTGYPFSLVWWLWLRPPLAVVPSNANSRISPGQISSRLTG